MLRQLIVISVLACAAVQAHAAEAGKVIFAAGLSKVADRAGADGTSVQEGDLLTTGADGFLYVKTVDNGLFILRPNTRARIVAYHIDRKNPANTRVKLELLSGVVRSKSGDAVKQARQNFRFNTPVAAIGVRGTDFTVYTDQNTSRVAVLTGGVVVSGFAGGCRPEGGGPCEGVASRELFAAQRGQMLEVKRGDSAPQVMPATNAPDQISPPRVDEPVAKKGNGVDPSAPVIDARKSSDLEKLVNNQQPLPLPVDTGPAQPQAPDEPIVTLPPVAPVAPVAPGDPVAPVIPVEPIVSELPPALPEVTPLAPERGIIWGRFAAIAGQAAQLNLSWQLSDGARLITQKGNYALLRDNGEFILPQRGSVGFELKGGEAFIYSDNPTVKPAQASLENGELRFDFDKRKFATRFDLVSAAERVDMHASGSVAGDGRFSVDSQFAVGNTMIVDGILNGRNAESASYLFQGRISDDRSVIGGTSWGRAPEQ